MRFFILFTGIAAIAVNVFAEDAQPSATSLVNHDKIMKQMDALIFKKIELRDATIEQTMQFLTEESKKSDPKHRGIQFVVHARPDFPRSNITLDDHNVSPRKVLRQIQRQCSYVYSVGDDGVYLRYDDGEGLTRRIFVVPNGFFEVKSEQAEQSSFDVKSQLEAKGIRFPPGRSAVYEPSQRHLIVTEDPETIDDIDYLLFKARRG